MPSRIDGSNSLKLLFNSERTHPKENFEMEYESEADDDCKDPEPLENEI